VCVRALMCVRGRLCVCARGDVCVRALMQAPAQLDCALGDGKIETAEYLRLVHKLSRQQFFEKELALKILAKRRSLGVF